MFAPEHPSKESGWVGYGGQSPDTPGKTYYIGLTLKFYLFKFYSFFLYSSFFMANAYFLYIYSIASLVPKVLKISNYFKKVYKLL
jgi:hypothetical protein